MSMLKQAGSEQFQPFLQKLKQLNLGPIAYQLMHAKSGPQWTKSKTIQAIAHYLGFLYLIYNYPHLTLAPTQEIDEVWHHHILDTSKYAEDCQYVFGCFIHHFPYFGMHSELDQQHLHQAHRLTQLLFREHFGIDLMTVASPLLADCEPLIQDSSLDQGCAASLIRWRSRPSVDQATDDALHILTPKTYIKEQNLEH